MKFKVAVIKDGQQLIKFVLDDGEEVWAETNQKVYDFAKKNFEENEVCDFDYDEKDDGSYFVNKIMKKEETSSKTPPKKRGRPKKSSTSDTGKSCECGTKIKDAKYDKCYNCNQADKEESNDKKLCECGKEIKNTKYDKCYTCNQEAKNNQAVTSTGKTCSECGIELKNPKYDKCYNCNKKTSGTSSSGKPDYEKGAPYGSVTADEAIRRNKLSVLGSISSAVATVMTGPIDAVDTLADLIIETHSKIYKELFE